MSAVEEPKKTPRAPRPAANETVSAPSARQRSGRRTLFLIVLVFLLGGVAGALVMRTRYRMMDREVVVSVNGVNITRADFFRRLEKAAGAGVIRQMVLEELQLQYARQKNLIPTDAQINARLEEMRKQPGFESNMARNGITLNEVKRALRVNMAQTAVLSQGVQVSDADVRRFYEQNIDRRNTLAQYYTPESIRIAVIITKTEAIARKALADMDKGIAWPETVKRYSTDSSKDNSGVMPPILRGRTKASKTVPGLEQAIFSLKIGQMIGPRQFAKAWWIIRCLDKKPEKIVPFEQVKEQCRTGAMLMKGLPANAGKVQQDFVEFQKKAKIQAFWTRYRDTVSTQP
jgi:parvulin-like peptidyl-prolyl isomerase